MDIQPRRLFLAIALHHAVKLPAVTLIKRGVVSNKVKCAPHPCRWLLTLRRIPARGSVLHVAFGRVSPGTNRGITEVLPAAGMEKDKKNARDTLLFESLKKAKLPWPVAPLYGITLDCKVVYV